MVRQRTWYDGHNEHELDYTDGSADDNDDNADDEDDDDNDEVSSQATPVIGSALEQRPFCS